MLIIFLGRRGREQDGRGMKASKGIREGAGFTDHLTKGAGFTDHLTRVSKK